MDRFCENTFCENPGCKTVPVSVRTPGDERRTLCRTCEEVYTWGVQHGQMAIGQGRLFILAIADRGLVSHVEAFPSKQQAETALIKYLRQNEAYQGPDDIAAAWRWLEEHDERLSVEIVEQPDMSAQRDALASLRRIYDVLYLDINERGDFYNENKEWSPDTLGAIADVVRSFFPKPPYPPAEDDDEELTPKDRAEFVSRIERVSPYDEGIDAHGNMVSSSEFMTDLLTDIRHYCDARDVDFAACDRAAHGHYLKECETRKEPSDG